MPFQDYGYKPSGITRPRARPKPKATSSSYYSGNEFGSGNIFTESSPGASTVNFGNNNNNNDNDNNSYQAPSLVQAPTPTVTAPAAPTPAQIEAERQDRIARVFEAAGATLPQDTGRGSRAGRGIDLYSRDIFTTPYVATPDNTQEIEDYLQRTAVDDALREALGMPEVYQGMPTQEEPETNIDMSVLQEALQPEPITVEELPDGTTPEMFEGMDGSYMFEDTDEEQPRGLMSRRFDTKGETPARELSEVLSIPEAAAYMGRERATLIMKGIDKLFGLFPPKTDVEKQAKSELEYFLDAQPESSLPDFFKYVPDKVQLAEYMKGRAERKKAAGVMNFSDRSALTNMDNLQLVDIEDEQPEGLMSPRPKARPALNNIKDVSDRYGSTVGDVMKEFETVEGLKPHIGTDWENVTLSYGIVPDKGLRIDGLDVPDSRNKRGVWLKKNGYVSANGKATRKFLKANVDSSNVSKEGIDRSLFASDLEWTAAVVNEFNKKVAEVYDMDTLSEEAKRGLLDIAWNGGGGSLEWSGIKTWASEANKAPEDRVTDNVLDLTKHNTESGKPVRGLVARRSRMANTLLPTDEKVAFIEQRGKETKLFTQDGTLLKTIKTKSTPSSPDGWIDINGNDLGVEELMFSPRPQARN